MLEERKNELLFLGTGTSQGIPIIACDCEVCTSSNPKDSRQRSSALIRYKGKHILIDTSPDFRTQMLREKITRIDAILYTHEHRDHTGGLDEIRPICWKTEKAIPVYAERCVQDYLSASFPYIFGQKKYPNAAQLEMKTIDEKPFLIEDIAQVTPIRAQHFEALPILGFRIGKVAYLTDVKYISDQEIEKLKGVEVLAVNALHHHEHPSHFSLSEAIDLIQKVQPLQGFITHIGHKMGLIDTVNPQLPKNIQLAYDGLKVCFS